MNIGVRVIEGVGVGVGVGVSVGVGVDVELNVRVECAKLEKNTAPCRQPAGNRQPHGRCTVAARQLKRLQSALSWKTETLR